MTIAKLPQYLVDRYKDWKENSFLENKFSYEQLAIDGQKPKGMIISCCDSRVHASSMFGAETGEFFIHRNIANLIPPYNPDGDHHGTSAAIEFAVSALEIPNIIILGHSNCGGIKNGYYLCKGENNNNDLIFVNKWLNILQPAYDSLNQLSDDNQMISQLEKESIKVSIKNLLDFPFIQQALDSKQLSIHGLWNDIGSGELEILVPETMMFKSI
jgi:carbonic anhydrase|tara:strand:- start:484 stop:1125 length:642 start_codon:yes stop_codon:yes gene_type:complete